MTDALPVLNGTNPSDADDADRDAGELEVFNQDEGVVVMGAVGLVEAYVARIRDEAGVDVRGRDLGSGQPRACLKRDLASLQGSIDEFARASEMQVADWSTHDEPGYRGTAEAIGELVSETWRQGTQASGRGFAQLSGRMRGMFDEKVVDPLADKVEARVRDGGRSAHESGDEDYALHEPSQGARQANEP